MLHKELHQIWSNAVKTYSEGNRGASTFFASEEKQILNSLGISGQEMFDYAEDYVRYGEPDFHCMILTQEVRYRYFRDIQKGNSSKNKIEMAALPAKTEEINGIVWLPRIIPKAWAKLKGELPEELMYACGGDRKFFKQNNIHPAEFLEAVWFYGSDENSLIKWVEERHKKAHGVLGTIKRLFD